MKYIIGIDPGQSGGVAVLDLNKEVVDVVKMPDTPREILDYLRKYENEEGVICYLERVGEGMPGQSSKATATFAKHNGHLEMALIAANIPFTKVTPQKWQLHYSNALGKSHGLPKMAWKRKLKELAQGFFPKTKVTLINADALLIARYGVEKEIINAN